MLLLSEKKWIDDVKIAEGVRLDLMLEKETDTFIGPRDFNDRHGWVLKKETMIQTRLDQIKEYTEKLDMVVNIKKTKAMSFCYSKKFAYIPRLQYDRETLEVVEKAKLLGVMVNSSGRWNDHVEYITNKARKRIFFLKRLKMLGASENT